MMLLVYHLLLACMIYGACGGLTAVLYAYSDNGELPDYAYLVAILLWPIMLGALIVWWAIRAMIWIAEQT